MPLLPLKMNCDLEVYTEINPFSPSCFWPWYFNHSSRKKTESYYFLHVVCDGEPPHCGPPHKYGCTPKWLIDIDYIAIPDSKYVELHHEPGSCCPTFALGKKQRLS